LEKWTMTTFTWIGASDTGGDFETGSLWSPGGPPGTSDTAILNSGTILIAGDDDVTIADFALNSTIDSAGSVTIENAGALNIAGSLVVGGAGTSSLSVLAGGTLITTDGIGPAADISATGSGSAIAAINGTGALWDVNGQLIVGDSGGGTLVISNGGLVNAGTNTVNIGNQLAANGTVLVNGGTLVAGDIIVQSIFQDNNGILAIGNGGLVTTSVVNVNGAVSMAGGTLQSDGQINFPDNAGSISGFGKIAASLVIGGSFTATGGSLEVNAPIISQTAITIAAGSVFQADQEIDNTSSVTFASSNSPEILVLDQPVQDGFAIRNWQTGDEIAFSQATTVSGVQWLNGGTLAVQTSGGTYDFTNVTLAAGLSPVFTTGTNFVELIPCFAAGTRIATPRGAIPVERLREGDTVLTISGKKQPIQWIGHRTVDCRRHGAPERVRPIRIAPHAFGESRPKRPLLLSPDHSVFVEDVLIPVKFLTNGTTVEQIDAATITYYHVELPRHDIVLAEGLPTETYLETGGRSAFQNGGGAMQLHPDFAPDEVRVGMVWQNFGYAPLIGTDGQLDRVRVRLAWQALMLGYQVGGTQPQRRRRPGDNRSHQST
jgi:collagen type I/II/III/V/XI/XXIV/XXVII alpha